LKQKNNKGSRDVWLNAAFESLINGGVEAVRIQLLSKKLNLSRASFYWFFEDREELLAALLELWRNKNTKNLIAQTNAYSETITEAILNIFDCWFDQNLFDSHLEFSIRSWALQSEDAARYVSQADKSRLEALKSMFIEYDYAPLSADVRARSIYLTQIGYISMKTDEDLDTRMHRIPEYVTIFTDKEAKDNELKRFYSRHR